MIYDCVDDFHGSNCRRRHHEREPGWRRTRRATRRAVNTAGGESSSLAYRTVHWHKLKPANHHCRIGAAAEELLPERVMVTLTTEGAEGKRGIVVEVNSDGTYEVRFVVFAEIALVIESELP